MKGPAWWQTCLWDLWLIPRNILFITFIVGLVQFTRMPILQDYLLTNRFDWFPFKPLLETLGGLVFINYLWKITMFCGGNFFKLLYTFINVPKKVKVAIEDDWMDEKLVGKPKFDTNKLNGEQNVVHMWDPSTMDYFGSKPVMNADQVKEVVRRSRIAQAAWQKSSFAKRRRLMRIMLRYFTENQEVCARVAVRESGTFIPPLLYPNHVLTFPRKVILMHTNPGMNTLFFLHSLISFGCQGKTMLDALIGEVLVTCEKLAWLEAEGEQYLRPEYRDTGRMMIMKKVSCR